MDFTLLQAWASHAALERLCRVAGVRAVIAFGSPGRGDAHAESDLDLAVICQEASLSPEGKVLSVAGPTRGAAGADRSPAAPL